MMDDNNKKHIAFIKPTIITPNDSLIPPSTTLAEPAMTSNKQNIISTKPKITPTELIIIISVKPAVTPTESTISPTEPRITTSRPRITPAELRITSTRLRIALTEPIKTPTEEALVTKDHIKRPNQPLFNVKNPKMWFNQFESKILATDLIEDLPVYYDLLKELNSHDILCCILDVFQNMSLINKYMYFRIHLLKKISEQERLIELVSDLKLEDKYPSFLLNEMKQLTSNKLSEHNLHRLWLQKLPPQIRSILLLSSDSLSSLSFVADNIKNLQYLPEVQLSKEVAYQYENEHGLTNSDDHPTENAQVINNRNSIQKDKKKDLFK